MTRARNAENLDWIVPPQTTGGKVTDAKQFRSTWLTASQASLRERGLIDAYERLLEPQYKAQVLSAVPGVWLPMAVAYAHYVACDRLGLPEDEMLEIGKAATRRANATTLAFVARLAQGSGVTPWTILAQAPRLWQSACDGGAIGVAKMGPKEARIDVMGFPLCAIRYNRVTTRGIALAVVELFCQKAYAKEVASLGDASSIVLKLSWV